MKKIVITTLLSLSAGLAFAADPKPTDPSPTGAWISFIPVILFTLALFFLLIGLKKSDVSLASLLAEKEVEAPSGNGQVTAPNAPPPASMSRLIVLLTGITSLIIGVSLTTFYMYEFFSSPTTKLDLSNLSTVIYGLGIGVIPYGFNKFAAGIKK